MVCKLKKESQKLRTAYWTLVGAASAMLITVQPVMADTIWDRFSTIMKDIYGQLVGISTIVAVTAAAIALLVRMISRNQRAVDEATSWLKRIQLRPEGCHQDPEDRRSLRQRLSAGGSVSACVRSAGAG